MALEILNGLGTTEWLKTRGAGTDIDPKVTEHDTNLLGTNGEVISVNNPLEVSGGTIKASNINVSGSDVGTFTGDITDLFDDLDTTFSSTGHSSPANFSIKLNGTVANIGMKLCSPVGKNFSNTKVTIKDRSGLSLGIVDESADNTKYSSRNFRWSIDEWCSLEVEFYTTDDIDLNWMALDVFTNVSSIVTGVGPDGMTYYEGGVTPEGAQLVEINAHVLPETSVHITRKDGRVDTLAVEALKGDREITVTNGAQFDTTPPSKIQILDGPSTEYDILKAVGVVGNVISLDRPLDADHPIGEDVIGVEANLKSNGSVTPVVYDYAPRVEQVVELHTIHILIGTTSEPSPELFGGLPALLRGVHFRVKNQTGRDYTFCVPFRSNGSFILNGFVVATAEKVGKNGVWYTFGSYSFARNSLSTIMLDGSLGQSFQAIVQDDISVADMVSLEVKLGLHEEPQ